MKLIYVILLSVFFIACADDKQSSAKGKEQTEKLAIKNLKNIEVQLSGMTCEIGCAKLIESKLHKVEGVEFVKVYFSDSIGNITYNTNKISENDIKNKIEKIAGGGLYSVVSIQGVANFK